MNDIALELIYVNIIKVLIYILGNISIGYVFLRMNNIEYKHINNICADLVSGRHARDGYAKILCLAGMRGTVMLP